ncbi:MAG: glycosyltransferase family 2 protein [Flavobacteriaceae bacterium]
MNNYPKISIVTPSYNQGQFLEDTILSVLGQFYPNLEYFIYDACSTDNSVDIIKKYENQISYWVSEKDSGQADAINKGFQRSTGDILLWLNSDDMLMPNVLNFIAKQYLKNGEGIYFGNCIHFEEANNGVITNGSNVVDNFNSIPLQLVDTLIQPSSFWSKSVWDKIGELNTNFHYGFDWEWFLRAKKKNIHFYAINKPLSMYRFHDAHKTGVGGKERREELHKIYSSYSDKYANLYLLLMHEKYEFNYVQKAIIKFHEFIFRRKINKTFLLKKFKKEYSTYTLEEIEKIKWML